jgi:hypothetical protein
VQATALCYSTRKTWEAMGSGSDHLLNPHPLATIPAMKETPTPPSGGSRTNHPYHTGQRASATNTQRQSRNSHDQPVDQDHRRYPSIPTNTDTGVPPPRYPSTLTVAGQRIDHSVRRDLPSTPTPRGQHSQADYYGRRPDVSNPCSSQPF